MEATAKRQITFDGFLTISTGSGRRTMVWKEKRLLWSALLARLSKTKRTQETVKEYRTLAKSQQDDIKDVGGFVGGRLKDGRRSAITTLARQLVTLDADFASPDLWEDVKLLAGHALACYSTHKHTPDAPRLRIIIPLDREVSPDEYQAIARKIADGIGIDYFDDTTYQAHRLMYFPSTSSDGDFFFDYVDAPWVSADAVLAEYDDWQDQKSWPTSSRAEEVPKALAEKQGDPLEKEGLIGVFCRAYSITEAMETFLEGIYVPVDGDDSRFSFAGGTSAGGAIVYDDKFLYSHHATDPCSMTLVNSFDLVRLHKYGAMDAGSRVENPTSLPSYKKMMEFIQKDARVKSQLVKERQEEIEADFSPLEDASIDDVLGEEKKDALDWTSKLEIDDKGNIKPTRNNIRIVLEHDEGLKGCLGWDEFSMNLLVRRPLPWVRQSTELWTDTDDSSMRHYFETKYGIDAKLKIEDETAAWAERHKFHKVRDYLDTLVWDGLPRVDSLLIDYLGAEDTEYTRVATRKILVAAIARVMEPGCKFDNMLVLEGAQGLGKSYLLKLLGRSWFSDSIVKIDGKEAFEALRGVWIVEMSELAAMKKAEVEPTKAFISKQSDRYRRAYGKRASEFPRQCVFFGTTNEATFLRDQTGNRRFWPVKCGEVEPTRSLWDAGIEEEIHQIWAEARDLYKGGESIWLGKELEKLAEEAQAQHTEESPYVGMIEEFLEREIPEHWYDQDLETRLAILRGGIDIDGCTMIKRDKVCVLELWCEMLGGDPKRLTRFDRQELTNALKQVEGWKKKEDSCRGKLRFGAVYGIQQAYIYECVQ